MINSFPASESKPSALVPSAAVEQAALLTATLAR